MITGNRGEWSEIYALFRLLGDKELCLGDKDINRLSGLVYPIIKIFRTESSKDYEYTINDDLILISGGKEILKIKITEFKSKAHSLLEAIKNSKGRSFSVPDVEEFMKSIECLSLKAGSSTKTDITIVVHDQRTQQRPALGFSIKSQLGSASTLLNAGKTTNFIYKISNVNFSAKDVREINSISSKSKIVDRVNLILKKGGTFQFLNTQRTVFSNNLRLIDSLLPEILSHVVFNFYSGSKSKLIDLVTQLALENPMNYDLSENHAFYDYKLKHFLIDTALGMMPSIVWTGKYDATGGYLIVKEDGDVLCYHIYNRNKFEDYLLNNTKLETASSSRHEFGKLYLDRDQVLFNLNLQIRFTK